MSGCPERSLSIVGPMLRFQSGMLQSVSAGLCRRARNRGCRGLVGDDNGFGAGMSQMARLAAKYAGPGSGRTASASSSSNRVELVLALGETCTPWARAPARCMMAR